MYAFVFLLKLKNEEECETLALLERKVALCSRLVENSSSEESGFHHDLDYFNHIIYLAFVSLKCCCSWLLKLIHTIDECLAALLAQVVICITHLHDLIINSLRSRCRARIISIHLRKSYMEKPPTNVSIRIPNQPTSISCSLSVMKMTTLLIRTCA